MKNISWQFTSNNTATHSKYAYTYTTHSQTDRDRQKLHSTDILLHTDQPESHTLTHTQKNTLFLLFDMFSERDI